MTPPCPISVVMPAYNAGQWIGRAIESVLAQTPPPLELIVVDDGSSDTTPNVCVRYSHRIRYIRQQNRGAAAARNTGIRAARGELVAFLNADDEWCDGFLEAIARLRDRFPEAGAYATGFRCILPGGRCFDAVLSDPSGPRLIRDYFAHSLAGPFMYTSSIAVPRSVFSQVGYFAEGEPMGEDLDMWGRIALAFPVAYWAQPLALYHQEASGRVCDHHSRDPRYPPFVRSYQKAVREGRVPPEMKAAVARYCSYLLLDYAKALLYVGDSKCARLALEQAASLARLPALELAGVWLAAHGVPIAWMRTARRGVRVLRAVLGVRGSRPGRWARTLMRSIDLLRHGAREPVGAGVLAPPAQDAGDSGSRNLSAPEPAEAAASVGRESP
ncbi:MAG: glycosyltransferase family 2 protein [Anaerolineae bacterium]|nr:glycosyltransferase family 2 protein [Anaerolineae bacterium]